MNNLPVHYRYFDSACETGVIIVEQKFYPIRETECFYFILEEFDWNLHKGGVDRSKYATRVRKGSRVSKCYPSKERALNSFLIRKQKQALHAKRTLKRVEIILSNRDKIKPENLHETFGFNEILIKAETYVSNNFIFD
jgi:hypothetical protein